VTPLGAARRGALVLALALAAGAAPAPTRAAEPAWQAEFADVCSRTQDAMSLADAELKALVARCDALVPAVEALEEPARKVQLRRLKACRELFQFVLESRAAEARP